MADLNQFHSSQRQSSNHSADLSENVLHGDRARPCVRIDARQAQRIGFDFERWYDRYNGLVMSVVKKEVFDRSYDADALNEAWMGILKAGPKYDPTRSTEAGFIVLIARARIIDFNRRRSSHSSRVLHAASADDLIAYDSKSAVNYWLSRRRNELSPSEHRELATIVSEVVMRLIGSLSRDQRQVVELMVFQRATLSETAQILKRPLGTVKSIYSRALAKMREKSIVDSEIAVQVERWHRY